MVNELDFTKRQIKLSLSNCNFRSIIKDISTVLLKSDGLCIFYTYIDIFFNIFWAKNLWMLKLGKKDNSLLERGRGGVGRNVQQVQVGEGGVWNPLWFCQETNFWHWSCETTARGLVSGAFICHFLSLPFSLILLLWTFSKSVKKEPLITSYLKIIEHNPFYDIFSVVD